MLGKVLKSYVNLVLNETSLLISKANQKQVSTKYVLLNRIVNYFSCGGAMTKSPRIFMPAMTNLPCYLGTAKMQHISWSLCWTYLFNWTLLGSNIFIGDKIILHYKFWCPFVFETQWARIVGPPVGAPKNPMWNDGCNIDYIGNKQDYLRTINCQ